jgi:hypothetical protein
MRGPLLSAETEEAHKHKNPGLIKIRTNIVSHIVANQQSIFNFRFVACESHSKSAGLGLVTPSYPDRGSVWGKKDRGGLRADASLSVCVCVYLLPLCGCHASSLVASG